MCATPLVSPSPTRTDPFLLESVDHTPRSIPGQQDGPPDMLAMLAP